MEKMQPRGGTEILLERLLARSHPSELAGINLIVSNTNPEKLVTGQVNVLWNHHSYDHPPIQNINSQSYLEGLDYIVYVSHWQAEKYSKLLKHSRFNDASYQERDRTH